MACLAPYLLACIVYRLLTGIKYDKMDNEGTKVDHIENLFEASDEIKLIFT